MIGFFRTLQGGIVVVSAALLAGWAWVASIKSSAVQQERVRVEKKATENAAKADAARRSVDRIPADRLRDKFCRDC